MCKLDLFIPSWDLARTQTMCLMSSWLNLFQFRLTMRSVYSASFVSSTVLFAFSSRSFRKFCWEKEHLENFMSLVICSLQEYTWMNAKKTPMVEPGEERTLEVTWPCGIPIMKLPLPGTIPDSFWDLICHSQSCAVFLGLQSMEDVDCVMWKDLNLKPEKISPMDASLHLY